MELWKGRHSFTRHSLLTKLSIGLTVTTDRREHHYLKLKTDVKVPSRTTCLAGASANLFPDRTLWLGTHVPALWRWNSCYKISKTTAPSGVRPWSSLCKAESVYEGSSVVEGVAEWTEELKDGISSAVQTLLKLWSRYGKTIHESTSSLPLNKRRVCINRCVVRINWNVVGKEQAIFRPSRVEVEGHRQMRNDSSLYFKILNEGSKLSELKPEPN